MAADEKLGLEGTGKERDHYRRLWRCQCGKALHVGHLRSAVIGESVKRMGRSLGHNVIGDAHI